MLKSDEPTVAKELEELGANEVRRKLARGEYGDIDSDLNQFVNRWLSSNDAIKKSSYDLRAERRSEDSLSISRRALRISFAAIIIATIAMILNASDKSDQFIKFLHWLGVLRP